MALAIPDFFTPTPTKRPPTERSTISQKLKKLFSQVDQQFAAEELQVAESFEDLVNQLADIELTGGDNLPSDESIRNVLKTAGKTTGDLDQAIERQVKAARLRQELTHEPAAIDALEEIQETIEREETQWEKTVAARQARSKQLHGELVTRQTDRDRFRQVRQKLVSLVGAPSERETEITNEIRECLKAENLIRSRTGDRAQLSEAYIGKSIEDSDDYKKLQALKVLIKEAEEGDSKAGSRGLSTHAFRLKKLYPRQEELTATLSRARQLYALGDEVVAARKQRAELQNEKDRLESQRRAKAESGQ